MVAKRTSLRLNAARAVGVAVVYYGAAKLGLDLAFATANVTAVWPPTGIALAAIVLWGYRVWPGVALGAFAANVGTGIPLYAVAGITVGNSLEALVGAFLLLRVGGFRPSLERVRDVIALVVLAAGVSTAVSASVGVGSLLAAGDVASGDLASVWRTWWLGDMGGALIVAPAIMVAVTHWPFTEAPGRAIEALAILLGTAGMTLFVFNQEQGLTYLIFPFLVWAVLRFWQPGATGASLLVAAIAVPLTAEALGPYAAATPDERLLLAQTFVGITGISAMVLAALVTERRRAEEAVEEIAFTLQESLLPAHLPHVPGLDVAATFRPAGEHHAVGGDFYDMFENDDGTWSVVVGDVCGKGAPAAALTSLARYTLRAVAREERSPSRALRRLNDAIRHHSPNKDFCTAVLARLHATQAGGRLTLAIGGHPPPLVLRASGRVEQAGTNGTLLGIVPDPRLVDTDLALAPGDVLVLYTDGLTEAQAPKRIVTAAELASVLAACAGRPPVAIVEHMHRALVEDGGAEPRDDVAVIALRALPRPRSA